MKGYDMTSPGDSLVPSLHRVDVNHCIVGGGSKHLAIGRILEVCDSFFGVLHLVDGAEVLSLVEDLGSVKRERGGQVGIVRMIRKVSWYKHH